MPIVDLAADWKCANADRLTDVRVRQVDPDTGPADTDAITDKIPAIQAEVDEPETGAGGVEIEATVCRFEFVRGDVGFDLNKRCRVEDATGRIWSIDSIKLDSAGMIYQVQATLTRG